MSNEFETIELILKRHIHYNINEIVKQKFSSINKVSNGLGQLYNNRRK